MCAKLIDSETNFIKGRKLLTKRTWFICDIAGLLGFLVLSFLSFKDNKSNSLIFILGILIGSGLYEIFMHFERKKWITITEKLTGQN